MEITDKVIVLNTDYDMEFHKFPFAVNLLLVIAQRAARSKNGEARLGDYRKYGMSRQEYRTSLKHLLDTNQITIRSTKSGVRAWVANTPLFQFCNFQSTIPSTISQPTEQPSKQPSKTNLKQGKSTNTTTIPVTTRPAMLYALPKGYDEQLWQQAREIVQERIVNGEAIKSPRRIVELKYQDLVKNKGKVTWKTAGYDNVGEEGAAT